MSHCPQCGALSEWLPDVGSSVCLQCGTLSHPDQLVLAAHIDHDDDSREYRQPWNSFLQNNSQRWALNPRQSKHDRDAKNSIAMHAFINTLASRLAHPGLASRAQVLFDHAMSAGHYRWGRRAKRTAGASVAIALREAHKGTIIADIAFLLGDTPKAISRSFASVVRLLQLNLSFADPSDHLPSLQTLLGTLLQPPSPLPLSLTTALDALPLPAVLRTATSLCALVTRAGILENRSSPASSCGIFLLAIEAETHASLPNCGELAKEFGLRFGLSKNIVMRRYKIVYDLVEDWIKEVPWLESYQKKNEKRSKLSKRVVVARGLKDVVQFQEEIWRAKLEALERPKVLLEYESEDEKDSDSENSDNQSVTPTPPRGVKRKLRQCDQASEYLVNPTSSGHTPTNFDMLTHMLTSQSHPFEREPTRLQMLVSSRGVDDIDDEELFADGEMDSLMRSKDEIAVLQNTFEWMHHPAPAEVEAGSRSHRKQGTQGTKRVNMDAYAKLMEDGADIIDDEKTDETMQYRLVGNDNDTSLDVEEWRPLSPTAARGADSDRFDEEA